MAIAACFVFQREISRSVFWDFFDSIGPIVRRQRMSDCLPSDKYGTLRTKAFFERSLKLIIGRI
jgi:hypothetical protein